MAFWLFKEEPEAYSFANLERDGTATWSGVSNPLAQKHLRSIKKQDQIFFYHTGKEKAVVGVMEAVGDPRPEPDDASGKRVVIDVKPMMKLQHAVPLSVIKSDVLFASWELVRIARLSVMPVPQELWVQIMKLSASPHK